jgi:hypothetical protein
MSEQRTTLWISLVFNDLRGMRGSYAIKNIEDYLPGLSKLYDHKMTRIEKEETKYRQHCWDILMAASLAYRPLSLSELAVLVPWSAKSDPYTIAKKCDSFLTTKEETVNLSHK